MDKKVIIVEGPAGAGKSRLVDFLIGEGYEKAPRYAHELRDFGNNAPKLSMEKDHAALFFAVTSDCEKVILDRCFFSQLVYEALRLKIPAEIWAQAYGEALIKKVDQLNDEWAIRCFEKPHEIQLRILWVLPDPDDLHDYRQLSWKEYPFDHYSEIYDYSHVADRIGGHILRPQLGQSPQEILDGLY